MVPKLTVEQARDARVCRVCGKPIKFVGGPKGWPTNFREMVYPFRVTLHFGEEFAHTDCLTKEAPGDHA